MSILASTAKKWPFKRRHIPFLLAHLGLLTVIAALGLRSAFGIKATIVTSKGQPISKAVDIHETQVSATNLSILEVTPVSHVRVQPQIWIIGRQAFIEGAAPVPLFDEQPLTNLEPVQGRWKTYAMETERGEELVQEDGVLLIAKTQKGTVCYLRRCGATEVYPLTPRTAQIWRTEKGFAAELVIKEDRLTPFFARFKADNEADLLAQANAAVPKMLRSSTLAQLRDKLRPLTQLAAKKLSLWGKVELHTAPSEEEGDPRGVFVRTSKGEGYFPVSEESPSFPLGNGLLHIQPVVHAVDLVWDGSSSQYTKGWRLKVLSESNDQAQLLATKDPLDGWLILAGCFMMTAGTCLLLFKRSF